MKITQRIEDDANRVMNEGRGLCRVLAVGVLLAVATVAGCVFTGCRLLTPDDVAKLDAAYEIWWRDYTNRMEQAGTVETPTAPQPEEPTAPGATVDAVDYSVLNWRYGGFNGGRAELDAPCIVDLRTDGRVLRYKWKRGLEHWGLSHTEAGAVCAVFFERNGEWVGGKFDWVSTSRSDRELKHVESYSSWPSSGIKLPWRGRVAFVVVSADGKRRSNVVIAEAK